MDALTPLTDPEPLNKNTIDSLVRLAILALLIYWAVLLIQPFLVLIAWSIILVIVLYPAYAWGVGRLHLPSAIAAGGLCAFFLMLLSRPRHLARLEPRQQRPLICPTTRIRRAQHSTTFRSRQELALCWSKDLRLVESGVDQPHRRARQNRAWTAAAEYPAAYLCQQRRAQHGQVRYRGHYCRLSLQAGPFDAQIGRRDFSASYDRAWR